MRILADIASSRSILPDSGSPTLAEIFTASRAWRQPIIPGTINSDTKKDRTI